MFLLSDSSNCIVSYLHLSPCRIVSSVDEEMSPIILFTPGAWQTLHTQYLLNDDQDPFPKEPGLCYGHVAPSILESFPGGCGVNVLESDEKEARANHWLQRMTYLYFQLTSKVLWGANLGRLREVMGSCSQFFFSQTRISLLWGVYLD